MKNKSKCTEAEILMGELIGRQVQIIKSCQRNLIGKQGKIVDETMKLLTIRDGRKEIKVPKSVCVFRFQCSEGSIDIDGRKLAYRPEERIKKHWRKFNGKMHR